MRIKVENATYDVEVDVIGGEAMPEPASAGVAGVAVAAPVLPSTPATPTALAGKVTPETVTLHIAGKILALHVKPGDRVRSGETLLDFQASGHLNPAGCTLAGAVHSPIGGTVQEVMVRPGQDVPANAPLLRIG
jgi:biotin carboxyl carrier protein